MTATFPSPNPFSIKLSPAEIADTGARNRTMDRFVDEGFFPSRDAAGQFGNQLAAHARGERVSPEFAAALAAEEKRRADQAALDERNAAAWRTEQARVAAIERRDRAAQRLGTARSTLAYLPALRAEFSDFDHGRSKSVAELIGRGQFLAGLAAVERDFSEVGIPMLERELADAAAALVANH